MRTAQTQSTNRSPKCCDGSFEQICEENRQLHRRLEVLLGVSGQRSTLVRQGKKIARLTKTNEELRVENAQLKRQLREVTGQCETLERQRNHIDHLEQENEQLKARLNRSNHKRYAQSSERKGCSKPTGRKRGAQAGVRGHGRTDRSQLPEVIEDADTDDVVLCEHCGEAYRAHGTVESQRIEIEVKAHKRIIRRRRYRRGCRCSESAATVTSEGPSFVIKGGEYGDSFWRQVLYLRYGLNMTLGNISRWFESVGLGVSKGTLLEHDTKFIELFSPLYEAIADHQNRGSVWYMDETSWPVSQDGGGYKKHWCWVSATPDSVRFLIDPCRSAQAGLRLAQDFTGTHLVCDRYSSYTAIAKQLDVTLAVCWSHARRDFVDVERGGKHHLWVDKWLGRISTMYQIHGTRMVHYEKTMSIEEQCARFVAEHRKLQNHINGMFETAQRQLDGLAQSSAKRKALERLIKYESGLRVFVDYPYIEPDNNRSERALRWMVIYRKLTYGSKSPDSAKLTAIMHSIFETLSQNGVDVHDWLEQYLSACAQAASVPKDIERFTPWGQPP